MSELPSPEDGGEMENVGSKRHRRPSVRLGEIGGEHSSFDQRKPKSLWKDSPKNNRHRTNLSSNQTLTLVDTNPNESSRKNWSNVDEEDAGDANLDDVTIGSWRIRNLKSKKGPVTKKMRSGWTPKVSEKDDKMLNIDLEDNENSGHSPVHSHDNNKTNDNVNMGTIDDIDRRNIDNVNSRKRGIRVSEDDPTDTGARDWNRGASERNGVKVWLNQLGLGQYASLFEIHEVDDEVLPMLTLEDLKDMGITAVGSRRKMYCSIQNLNKDFS